MTKNEFSEALALARLVAEKTGCGLERALAALVSLSGAEAVASATVKAQNGAQMPAQKASLPRSRKRLPINVLNFVATCPAGTELTGREIFESCGLQFPAKDKKLSYFLKAAPEWQRIGKKGGMALFRREASHD